MDTDPMPQNWNEQADSQKLDKIIMLIEGADNSPGISGRLRTVEIIVFGDADKGTSGMLTKMMIMWRMHIWLLCTLSAAMGFMGREIIKAVWHF